MKNITSKIGFDLSTHQGRFHISYMSSGYVFLTSYCTCLETGKTELGFFSGWFEDRHEMPVEQDMRLPEDLRTKKYLAHFMTHFFARTGLEREEDAVLKRIEVHSQFGTEGETPVKIVFREDGKGWIVGPTGWTTHENGRTQNFEGPCIYNSFDFDPTGVAEDCKSVEDGTSLTASDDAKKIADEVLDSYHGLFWDEINNTFEHRYLQWPEDLEGSDLTVGNGSVTDLENDVKAIAQSCKDLWQIDEKPKLICLRAGVGTNHPHCSEYDGDNEYLSTIAFELLSHLAEWRQVEGYEWEYNDGSRISYSGYSPTSSLVTISVEPPTASQQAQAAARVQELLVLMKRDPGELNELLGEAA